MVTLQRNMFDFIRIFETVDGRLMTHAIGAQIGASASGHELVGKYVAFRFAWPGSYAVGKVVKYNARATKYKFTVRYADGLRRQNLIDSFMEGSAPSLQDHPGAWCVLQPLDENDWLWYVSYVEHRRRHLAQGQVEPDRPASLWEPTWVVVSEKEKIET